MLWIRQHGVPRQDLFSPGEADRGPKDLEALWNVRRTEGIMKDGRKFSITDDWGKATEQARRMRQAWTGTTTFICRTPSNKLDKMSNVQEAVGYIA